MKTKTHIFNFFRKLLRVVLGCRLLRAISNGKTPNSFIGKIIPPHYLFKKATIKEVVIDNMRYSLDISRVVDHYIYFGFSDRGFENFIQLLKPDFIVFDVGANIGVTVLPISQRVSHVYAFEPSSTSFKKLTEHVEMNSIQNTHLFQLGVGNQELSLLLETVNPANPGMNRIRYEKSLINDSEAIKIISLDRFVLENNIEHVDAIKIDIEGFELKSIQGAQQILTNQHPLLFIELDDNLLQEQGANAVGLISELYSLGYNSICIANSLQKIDKNFEFKDCHFDILVSKTQ